MINMTIREAKQGFFDTEKVTKAIDKATRKNLSKFGAFVRRTARSSMKTSKGISRPGDPPKARKGYLKQFLYFAYDAQRKSVVIGPVKLGESSVPKLLEYGGQSIVKSKGKHTPANYKARPFMGPAFEKELPKIDSIWKDSIK